jgi:hypothetical protein
MLKTMSGGTREAVGRRAASGANMSGTILSGPAGPRPPKSQRGPTREMAGVNRASGRLRRPLPIVFIAAISLGLWSALLAGLWGASAWLSAR